MLRGVIVVGDSMYPTLQDGDVVLVITGNKKIKLGDVIVYREIQQGFLVIHRIESIRENGFITRGDGNNFHDPMLVKAEQIVGTVCFIMPWLRWLVKKMRKKEEGR